LKRFTGRDTGSRPGVKKRISFRAELFLAILAVTLACVLFFALLSNYLVRRQFERAYREMPRLEPPGPLGGPPPEWEHAKRERINVVNYSYIFTGLLGVMLAFILSLYFSSRFSHPLSELTAATRGIAAGDYGKRVEVKGTDELEELGAAFNSLAESLEKNERSRRAMIADISHELRSPLAVQQGYLEAMRDGVLKPDGETLEALLKNNALLSQLVEDLRQLALLDAGQPELDINRVDAGEALQAAAALFRQEGQEAGVGIEVEAEEDLPPVRADQARLQQVLGNLLRNALQYAPRGGRVTLRGQRGSGEVLFRVEDNGTGISPEDLPFIFDRFYRADRSRSRDTGGSGLGLSIARALVEAQGGRIWAESGLGCGTSIYFTLPEDESA